MPRHPAEGETSASLPFPAPEETSEQVGLYYWHLDGSRFKQL